MEEIVIQVGPRNGQQTRYQKSSSHHISIGRAFSNDLILSDPYVAAEQLVIRQAEGQWLLQLLDQANPVFLNGKPIKVLQSPIQSGDRVHIGRTQIRIFAADHAVEPVRKLPFSNWFYQSPWRPLIPWIVVAMVALAIIGTDYLQSYLELEWQDMASNCLVGILALSVWSGIWAIVGKVLRHQPQFYLQLTVTGLVYLIAVALEFILGPLDYITNSESLSQVYHWLSALMILTLLIYANISIASNIRKPQHLAFIVSAISLIFLFAIYKLDDDSFHSQPQYSQALAPPMFKWHGDIDKQDYILDLEDVFEQVEEQREE